MTIRCRPLIFTVGSILSVVSLGANVTNDENEFFVCYLLLTTFEDEKLDLKAEKLINLLISSNFFSKVDDPVFQFRINAILNS